MRIQFQTEDILNRKEVEGSAAENLKCLYLYTGYFEQPEIFTKNVVYFGTNLNLSKPAKVTFYIFLHEGNSALVQKNYHIRTFTKSFSFL